MDEDSVSPMVRRVRSDEGHALRASRLAALKESPFAFASSYESEELTDDEWTARARSGAAGIDRVTFFALVNDQMAQRRSRRGCASGRPSRPRAGRRGPGWRLPGRWWR